MADEDLVASGRKKNVVIVKPIVYGNVARYFGKKREEDGHTHSWSCYLRPFKNEDMSSYIKKVQFRLHESYPSPVRVLTSPPFEVHETGWGEFEIQIKIFFTDTTEKPVTLYHLLRLFQADPLVMAGKKNVVSEQYDEMVFTDPTNLMYQLLSTCKPMIPAVKHESSVDYKEQEEKSFQAIAAARKKVKGEIQELTDKLKQNKETKQKLREELAKLEDKGY